MTTRELIQVEVAKVPEESLDELYGLVRSFAAAKMEGAKPSVMAKLRMVKIEAPSDFAANLDFYLSGEKSVGEDVH
jgi:hypothetical protein